MFYSIIIILFLFRSINICIMAKSDSYKDLEELGIDCEAEDELTTRFDTAAAHLQSIVSTVDNSNLALLYGYYKQAKEGRCTIPKPGWFDAKGRHKWEAWHKLGDMPRNEAKMLYIETIKKIDGSFNFEQTKKLGWINVSTLQSNNDDMNDSKKSLTDYVKDDEVVTVSNMLRSFDDYRVKHELDQLDGDGMGLIHWAADRGSIGMLQLLLSMDTNVDLTDADQQTSLHYAASCGHTDCVKLLLDYGADAKAVDANGETPIDVCSDEATKAFFLK